MPPTPVPSATLPTVVAPPVWRASWIWDAGEAAPRNYYLYLRKTVDLPAAPAQATVRITADTRYILYVNGNVVSRGPARSDPRFQAYATVDLAPHLRHGRNAIAALVHHAGEGSFRWIPARAGFLLDGDVVLPDGAAVPILSDASWKVLPGEAWERDIPRMRIQLGFPELYDARKAPEGWTKPAFDDAGWAAATVVGPAGCPPWTTLEPDGLPPQTSYPRSPQAVVDFGRIAYQAPLLHVDFLPHVKPSENVVAYLRTHLHAERAGRAEVRTGSNDGLRLWFNGALVLDRHIHRQLVPDQDRAAVDVKAGWNTVLAKVDNGGGGFGLYFQLVPRDDVGAVVYSAERDAAKTADPCWLLGPFPNGPGPDGQACSGFAAAFPPETETEPAPEYEGAGGQKIAWKRLPGGVQGDEVATRSVASLMHHEVRSFAASGQVDDPSAILAADGMPVVIRPPGPRDGTFLLLDFGQEMSGIPELIGVAGPDGAILDLGYAECLTAGRFTPMRQDTRYADRYRIRPGGPQDWALADKRAFRYLQVSVRNAAGPVSIDAVRVRESRHPVRYRGLFRSGDPLLNRIWEVSRRTMELCMEDAYIDSPWRERGQWPGNLRVQILAGQALFGDTVLAARGLRQLAQGQRENGSLRPLWPASAGAQDYTIPDYVAIWIMAVRDHVAYTGDDAFAKELYPAVKRAAAYLQGMANDRGLLAEVPGWIFIDWPMRDDNAAAAGGEIGPLNAFYYRALLDAAALARAAGAPEEAAAHEATAAKVKESFHARFWSEEKGVYVHFRSGDAPGDRVTLHGNVLPLAFGMVPDAVRSKVRAWVKARLAEKPRDEASPYFLHYALEALAGEGLEKEALDLIRKAWGWQIANGVTTLWENWNPDESWCHAWGASPGRYLPERVLGVRAEAPGATVVRVEPSPADLAWVEGVVPTVRGDVAASWSRNPDGGYRMKVTALPGITTRVGLPLEGRAMPWVRLNGDRLWEEGKIVEEKYLGLAGRMTGDRLVFTLTQPGGYTFEMKGP